MEKEEKEIMPNKNAKARKQNKAKLNAKFAREGRTANQYKKWKAKNKDTINKPRYR